MDQDFVEKVVAKRAPRKRVARPATTVSVVDKPPRKRAVRKKVENVSPEKSTDQPVVVAPVKKASGSSDTPVKERKAPTTFAVHQGQLKNRRKQILIASTILLIGVGASAGVGLTGEGRIDVQQTIEERNERLRTEGGTINEQTGETTQVEVPVQNPTTRSASTLKSRGSSGQKTPVEVAPTATTTTDTATSTDTGEATTTADTIEESSASEELEGSEETDVTTEAPPAGQ